MLACVELFDNVVSMQMYYTGNFTNNSALFQVKELGCGLKPPAELNVEECDATKVH